MCVCVYVYNLVHQPMAPLPERPVITGRAGLMRRQIRGRWRRRVVGAAEEVIAENFIRSPK